MNIIEVKNISKKFMIPHERRHTLKEHFTNLFRPMRYNTFHALKKINFEVKKGEFLGIIGRNGSGKSTLLKILANIYKPDTGKVKVHGSVSPFLELGVGFNGELTARENIYLNGTILGLTKKEIEKKFNEIIEFAELQDFVDMKVKNYSSGMYVRLAFSVAIQADADILLLDEVLAVGDANFQEKCYKVFQRLKREGKTIILVTHSMENVEEFCDRAVLLEKGRIIESGKPKRVTHEYSQYNEEKAEKETDEKNEKAIQEEINQTEWGTKKAMIEDCWIEVDGKKQLSIQNGDVISVKLKITFQEKLENPIFGITVRDSSNRNVFVTNTKWQKTSSASYDKGDKITVTFTFDNMLAEGNYYISPAIASKDAKEFYHWQDNLYEFISRGKYDSGGICDFRHKIIINK